MKLERLTISNFMRIADADVNLSAGNLHLFCGTNEAGKSSVSEAIRFALTGDTPRIAQKQNYKLLLPPGAKKGFVSLQFDGQVIQRNVTDGKATGGLGDMPESAMNAAKIAIGAQEFVRMKADDRRKMFFDVVGISMGKEEILKRLTAINVDKAVREFLAPVLTGSVDAAYNLAKDRLVQLRAQWSATTNETFGTEKAAGWTAPAPGMLKPAETDVVVINNKIVAAEQELGGLNRQLGAFDASARDHARLTTEISDTNRLAANKTVIEKDIANIEAEILTLSQQHQLATEMIERLANAGKIVECPYCDAPIKLVKDPSGEITLGYGKAEDADFFDEKGLAGRQEEIRKIQQRTAALREDLEGNKELLAKAKNATKLNAEAQSKINALPDVSKKPEVEAKVTKVSQTLAELRGAAQALGAYKREVEAAERATSKAADILKQFKAWDFATDALAPSGIPAQILAEAMGPINKQLAATAALANWAAPFITDDMEVMRVEADRIMPYSLLSESARWRVSSMIADVIATRAGLKVLILDRWDVLDMQGRAQFLKWVKHLASDSYDTVITMATLKEKPDLPGFEVHWIDKGSID